MEGDNAQYFAGMARCRACVSVWSPQAQLRLLRGRLIRTARECMCVCTCVCVRVCEEVRTILRGTLRRTDGLTRAHVKEAFVRAFEIGTSVADAFTAHMFVYRSPQTAV